MCMCMRGKGYQITFLNAIILLWWWWWWWHASNEPPFNLMYTKNFISNILYKFYSKCCCSLSNYICTCSLKTGFGITTRTPSIHWNVNFVELVTCKPRVGSLKFQYADVKFHVEFAPIRYTSFLWEFTYIHNKLRTWCQHSAPPF